MTVTFVFAPVQVTGDLGFGFGCGLDAGFPADSAGFPAGFSAGLLVASEAGSASVGDVESLSGAVVDASSVAWTDAAGFFASVPSFPPHAVS